MLLTESIKAKLGVLEEKYRIALILLFGSHAKGDAREDPQAI